MSDAESETVVSVSAGGQTTISEEFRDELGVDTPGRVRFVRTEDGEILVRPIRSITDLRGVLAGKTDEDGCSAVERLRVERTNDRTDEATHRDRCAGTDDTDG